MHYYQFNIKSYKSDTYHLTNDEDLAYRRLLDIYYDTEQPIPNDIPRVSRRLKLGSEIVETVLKEFFTLDEGVWRNKHCEAVLLEYRDFLKKQKENGIKGGRPKKNPEKPTGFEMETQNNPNNKPLTTNHKPETNINLNTEDSFNIVSLQAQPEKRKSSSVKGFRMSTDWVLGKDQGEWALKERPDLTPDEIRKLSEAFRDYFVAKTGKGSTSTNWDLNWRNWIRNDLKFNGIKHANGKPKFDPAKSAIERIKARRDSGRNYDDITNDLRGQIYEND